MSHVTYMNESCTHAGMHARAYARTHVYTHARMHASMHARTCTNKHVRAHTYTHTHITGQISRASLAFLNPGPLHHASPPVHMGPTDPSHSTRPHSDGAWQLLKWASDATSDYQQCEHGDASPDVWLIDWRVALAALLADCELCHVT